MRLHRSLLLQQSSDMWWRFDCHYESLPHRFLRLRLPAVDKQAEINKLLATPLCCADGASLNSTVSHAESCGMRIMRVMVIDYL